jgi:uncharacterized membrane protein YdbT with pleckstrin-like domain
MNGQVVIPKTWRSEVGRSTIFLFLCGLSIILSRQFPGSVINGKLFTIGPSTFFLSLPLYGLMPLTWLGDVTYRIYNVRYAVDGRGIEGRVGILSLKQSITRLRFEDIRSIEVDQSLLDRILNVGDLQIGTAATSGVEMVLSGIAAPYEVQDMMQKERDGRQRGLEKTLATELGEEVPA